MIVVFNREHPNLCMRNEVDANGPTDTPSVDMTIQHTCTRQHTISTAISDTDMVVCCYIDVMEE